MLQTSRVPDGQAIAAVTARNESAAIANTILDMLFILLWEAPTWRFLPRSRLESVVWKRQSGFRPRSVEAGAEVEVW
jgi:transposase